jgi:hypothetical protein
MTLIYYKVRAPARTKHKQQLPAERVEVPRPRGVGRESPAELPGRSGACSSEPALSPLRLPGVSKALTNLIHLNAVISISCNLLIEKEIRKCPNSA